MKTPFAFVFTCVAIICTYLTLSQPLDFFEAVLGWGLILFSFSMASILSALDCDEVQV